jgi:Reverse transcriptase (RNA-dependent DNA polymerase).
MGKKKWADLSPEERWERNKHLKMLEKQTRQLTPTEPLDETYKRIQYTRYADDFIIGVIGSKADAEQMKADVGRFLREELDLEMSETKTKGYTYRRQSQIFRLRHYGIQKSGFKEIRRRIQNQKQCRSGETTCTQRKMGGKVTGISCNQNQD